MACWQVGILRVVALVAAVPTAALAQGYCRPPDSTAMVFLAHIARHAAADSGVDAEVRDSLRLRYTSRDQVALSQDEELCRQAALAYRRELTTAAETHTGRVYVVQAGINSQFWTSITRSLRADRMGPGGLLPFSTASGGD